MYDMYPWDSASQGDYPPNPSAPGGAISRDHPSQARPAQAVQVALDRRDNGGDGVPVASASQPPASLTRQ